MIASARLWTISPSRVTRGARIRGRRTAVTRAAGSEDPFDNAMGKSMLDTFSPEKERLSIAWGGIKNAPVPISVLDDDSPQTRSLRKKLREDAAKTLVNIDSPERDRRRILGATGFALAAAVAVALSANGVENPLIRALALYLPISVGVQFFGSGEIGLCGIGQAGLWDVDGTGVCPVPDKSVALAIKQKTDAFWQRAAATAVAIDLTVAFAPTVLNLIQQ